MNYEDINYNEIKISGTINNITDTNDKYIKYGLTSFKYTLNGKSNIYVSLNISRELYNTYKDYFIKGNKVIPSPWFLLKPNQVKGKIKRTYFYAL